MEITTKHSIQYNKADILQAATVAAVTSSIAVNKLTAPSFWSNIEDLLQTGLLGAYEARAALRAEQLPLFETVYRRDGSPYVRPVKVVYRSIEKAVKSYIRQFAIPVKIDNPLMVFESSKQGGYSESVAEYIISTAGLSESDEVKAFELLNGTKALRHISPSIRERLRAAIARRLDDFYIYSEEITIDFEEIADGLLTITYP